MSILERYFPCSHSVGASIMAGYDIVESYHDEHVI